MPVLPVRWCTVVEILQRATRTLPASKVLIALQSVTDLRAAILADEALHCPKADLLEHPRRRHIVNYHVGYHALGIKLREALLYQSFRTLSRIAFAPGASV